MKNKLLCCPIDQATDMWKQKQGHNLPQAMFDEF